MSSDRRLLRIEREARFEAARGVLMSRLEGAERDDPWFRTGGVTGRLHGRDVDVRFPGGYDAAQVRVAMRIRTGGRFTARPRGALLRWLGRDFLALSGTAPPETARYGIERLLRDYGALRVAAGDGLVRADVCWDPHAPEPERVLKVLDRLHRLALALEDVHAPLLETGGLLACPFCREPIAEDAPLARCDACHTPYHPACFDESGGCAIYGCRNRTARTSSQRLAAVETARAAKAAKRAGAAEAEGEPA